MTSPDQIEQPQPLPAEQADDELASAEASTPAPSSSPAPRRFFGFSDNPEAAGWNEGSWVDRSPVEPS